MNTIFTIGHSNHGIDHFLQLLRRHEIAVLVDVRTAPYSKHVPWFNKRDLERAVTRSGIEYLYLGMALGGKPPAAKADFEAGIAKLISIVEEKFVAVCCAEENPRRCHRVALISPALRERGVEVGHIRGDGSLVTDGELRCQKADQLHCSALRTRPCTETSRI